MRPVSAPLWSHSGLQQSKSSTANSWQKGSTKKSKAPVTTAVLKPSLRRDSTACNPNVLRLGRIFRS